MFKIKLFLRFTLLFTIVVFWGGCAGVPDGVRPVTNFDAKRFAGKWFEIARLPNDFEDGLNNVYFYFLINKKGAVKILNTGFSEKERIWKEAEGTAYFTDKNKGHMRVTFLWPFYFSYNIILLDSNYRYAVVCGSSKDHLWILSRTSLFPQELLFEYVNILKKVGFDTNKLIFR